MREIRRSFVAFLVGFVATGLSRRDIVTCSRSSAEPTGRWSGSNDRPRRGAGTL
jgi:hypothetical protein